MRATIRLLWRHGWLVILFTLTLLLISVLPAPSHAQSRSIVVDRRDGVITIQPNGNVEFVETWQVRFIGGPFRQGFREIPLNRATGIGGWQVSEAGVPLQPARSGEQPGTFVTTSSGSGEKVTWYFRNPAGNETRTFTLRYVVAGALRIYDDGDQFFWKFIEQDREYPIRAAQVRVLLPQNFSQADLLAGTYFNGQPVRNQEIIDGRTVLFTGGPFDPGDEWEVRVQFPHGVVTATPHHGRCGMTLRPPSIWAHSRQPR